MSRKGNETTVFDESSKKEREPYSMPLRIYNTLTRKKEEFKPIKEGFVGMYTCGPTVYDYAHVGHYRAYTFVDTLKRALLYNGFKVRHVMNLTDVGHLTEYDVEEQMRKRGKGRGTVWGVADFYAEDFFQAMTRLNVLEPDIVCKASDHIKEQILLIERLELNGFTYKTGDGIYFDISRFPQYGELARLKLDGQEAGARVDVNPQKKNPYDFALWKFTKPEEKKAMEWDSPWGRGVPGWHIECSAMSMKYLGESFDIHTGGVDLVPIHHTNEIAQSEAATGKKFVNYWLHNAHLLVGGERMSRSKGNFYTMADIEQRGFSLIPVRYLFLTAHHRAKMNFTWEALEGSQVAYGRLVKMMRRWQESAEIISPGDEVKTEEFRRKFEESLNDDLDMPGALVTVWKLAASDLPASSKLDLILDFDQVLGLKLKEALQEKGSDQPPREIKALVERRENLRKQLKWGEADEIRKQIEELGWIIEDTPKGPSLKERLKR